MPAKVLALAFILCLVAGGAVRADTLATVKARGSVLCGTTGQPLGFSATSVNGTWSGLGADYCRGLAAVVLNDPSKVSFITLQPEERISALAGGRVDALADLLPWNLTEDTEQGLLFVGTMFYDGQGFLAPKSAGLRSARDLAGKPVCVDAGSPAEADLAEYFDANNISARVTPEPTSEAAIGAYLAGTCLAYSANGSILANARAQLPAPADNVLLPDIITKTPLGPVVRQQDDRWFDIARWTLYALLDAEELGVTQTNVDEMLGSDNIQVRRLLGVESDFGAEIGLNKDWAYELIKGVGNYADIYDRNIGEQTPLKLPRGLNALWSRGGIQYSPPVR
ncbi:MAG TPA: amino acid ABC transporter substrate-binding protein [Devosiaceae bacterium]|nr:amino acid ABC transporter substrate-binding protein [Devosiaceae bacterium]